MVNATGQFSLKNDTASSRCWGTHVAKVVGGMRLHVSVQDAMRAYFCGRGEKVPALPWALEGMNDEAWVRRWTARLHAAGIKDDVKAMRSVCM